MRPISIWRRLMVLTVGLTALISSDRAVLAQGSPDIQMNGGSWNGDRWIGDEVNLTVVNPLPWPVTTIKWEARYTAGSYDSGWTLLNQGPNLTQITFPNGRQGTAQVRATVTYGPRPIGIGQSEPPPVPFSLIGPKTLTYKPADGFRVVGFVPANRRASYGFGPNKSITITLQLQAGGNDRHGAGYSAVFEKISYFVPQLPPEFDGGWGPPLDHPLRAIWGDGGGRIYDEKGLTTPGAYVGELQFEYDQRIGIQYMDFSGATHIKDIGGLHIHQECYDLTPGTSGEWELEATKN